MALVFERGRPAAEDALVREALARSIDRAAIYNVLLQRQGEVAGGLLPQWLSGYAFLFATAPDLERARKLWSQISPAPRPLVLGYDLTDPLARAVAERIAVDAREAGITLQVSWQASPSQGGPPRRLDGRLVRRRIQSAAPGEALTQLADSFALGEPLRLRHSATPEELFAAERAIVESFRVIPLFQLPEIYGLSPRVKNWSGTRWGGWRLDDVWLDVEKP